MTQFAAPQFVSPSAASTVLDVARLANVSASTVSRILNGNARVSPDKREAVEEAIRKLKFRPNLSARSLRSRSTKTIGILTQDLESPYFTGGTKGIEQGLLGSGYAPLVVPGHWNLAEELDRARLLISRKVDAMIILGGTLGDDHIAEMAQQQPIAVTGRHLVAANVYSFHFDQVAGGRMATEHLISLGHKRIAHITGPVTHSDAVERKEGYLQAHANARLSVDPRLIVEGDYVEEGGERAINSLLDSKVPFSAVFCANDPTLWGARLALHRRGIEVPGQISLVGFDDMPQSMYMTPPVTTVRQPMHQMGQVAAQAVLRALGLVDMESYPLPSLNLVVRETTASFDL
ncbi:MAG: LacI family DNA-binding transcriptional regulator [Betaproteobacteria bacterium]|nr:MAG: LacI family DNA-binding transcriptional regulator [Betaproteobacteria bacterium]